MIIQDTPQQAQKEKTHIKEGVHESSIGEVVQRRRTRIQLAKEKGKIVVTDESPVSKGNLNDLLQAIDIEESPLVQEDLIKSGKDKTKNIKASKKLKFDDQVSKFVFKPRRPMTRHFKQVQEMLPEAGEIEEIEKTHERPMTPLETSSQLHEELKKKLRLANLEIARLKKASRKHAIKEAQFNKMEALWEDKTFSIPAVVDCNTQYYTWTVPALKEAEFIKKVNTNLRAGIRVMKRQIEDLRIQLSQRESFP